MRLKFFLIIFSLVFFVSFVIACEAGEMDFQNEKYCDIYGEYQDFIAEGEEGCLNDYECGHHTCEEGFCGSQYTEFGNKTEIEERTSVLQKLLDSLLSDALDCDPAIHGETWYCEGTNAFLCGENGIWELKGDNCVTVDEINICGDCVDNIYAWCDLVSGTDYCVLAEYDSVAQCDQAGGTFIDRVENCPAESSICGDGNVDTPNSDGFTEECDDSNLVDGDGCSAICELESCSSEGEILCIGFNQANCTEGIWVLQELELGLCYVACLGVETSCDGENYLICNNSYLFENQGKVNGECGYDSSPSRGPSSGPSSSPDDDETGAPDTIDQIISGAQVIDLSETVCGDGSCDFDESSFICPEDCEAKKASRKWIIWLVILVPLLVLFIAFIFFKIRKGKKSSKKQPGSNVVNEIVQKT